MTSGQDPLSTRGPLGRRRFRVGPWTADPQLNQISSAQRTVKLEPKVMALLVYLAERPGQTVGRDELLDALWSGVAVVEEALTRCVSQLRRALADDTQEPRYIQTVSKRGYRLVAPVVLDESRRFESREAAPVPHEPQLALVARESQEKRTTPIVAGVLTIALVATLIPAVSFFRSSATSTLDVRFTIDVPQMPSPYDIALSPNGRYVAYVAAAGQGRSLLWIRAVNALEARALPDTEGATEPFWSPDSEYLAFGARTGVASHLKKINISGAAVHTIADLGSGNFCCGAWNRDGVIVFSHRGVLHRVPASGGEVTTISTLDPAREEMFHARPQFLPDGRHFLYLAWSARSENRSVHIGSLDSDTTIRLMATESNAVYAPPGFLLFLRDRTLMARPFDAGRMRLTGDAVPVATNIVLNSVGAVGAFAASNEGTLIYRSESPDTGNRFVWIDRHGRRDDAGVSVNAAAPVLSPDGNHVAFAEGEGGVGGIWLYDLDRGVKTRVITEPAGFPVWSPDGSRLIVGVGPLLGRALYEKSSNGATPERLLFRPEPGGTAMPLDWSAAGDVILFTNNAATSSMRDLWVLWLSDKKASPYLTTPDDELHAALSPDGRWLAYVSSESGTYQVIVQSFPDPSRGRWQMTADGGVCPQWKRDGTELYYLNSKGEMVAASVKTGRRFEVGKSAALFQTRLGFPSISIYRPLCPYDVTRDGERFLVSEAGDPVPISVILNWSSILKH